MTQSLSKHTITKLDVYKYAIDEPIFVIRARDNLALTTVQRWIDHAVRAGVPELKIMQARACIHEMKEWRYVNASKVKLPD